MNLQCDKLPAIASLKEQSALGRYRRGHVFESQYKPGPGCIKQLKDYVGFSTTIPCVLNNGLNINTV